QHPNIVNVYRYGEDRGLIYIAMQYIEGADLGTVIDGFAADGDFMENADVQRITREIASALDYAHSRGVIHRDVKPSNIMLNKSGQAILTDFGLALMTDVGTVGEIFGSPHYIAPEQAASSKSVVPQSDLYSLGIVLFEMFTNVLPFDAPEALDVAMQHMSDPPPLPRQFRPDLNEAVEAVILKALAKKPEDRFQTGAELANALDTALTRIRPRTPSINRVSVLNRVEWEVEANPLPPIPAAVAAAPATRPARHTPSIPAASSPDVTIPASPAKESPRMIYLVGLAVLFIVLCGVVILLGPALLDDDEPSNDATDIIDVTVTPTSTDEATDVPSPLLPTELPAPVTPTQFPSVSPVNPPTTLPTGAPTGLPALNPPTQVTQVPTNGPTAITSGEAVLLMAVTGNARAALYIINTGDVPFTLSEMVINYKDTSFDGSEWAGLVLETGQCVRVWNKNEYQNGNFAEKEDKALNDLPECQLPVGSVVTREGRDQFWQDDYTVLVNNELKAECKKDDQPCEVRWQ
ncbi:MAG: protein kinase, partial [Chloroflexi bacterium]|nr:protein kinase [Chloroflexota bacterium]